MAIMKWKKIAILGLTLLSFSSLLITVGAEEEPRDKGGFLSLEEVVVTSLSNNHSLASLDDYIQTKRVDLGEKKASAARLDEKKVTSLDLGKIKYFLPFDAEVQVEIAKLDRKGKEDEISLSSIQAYMDLYFMDQGIEVMNKSVNRAEEQVKISNLNYQLGMITKADLLAAEVQLSKAKSQWEEMKNNRNIKMMQLNQVMGQPLQTELRIGEPQKLPQLPDSEEAIQAGLSYSTNLKKLAFEKNSLEKLLEVTRRFRTDNTYAVESVQAAIRAKEASIEEARSKVEFALRSLQLQMGTKYSTYLAMEQQVKKIEESYRIMAVQYKEGFTSYQDLLNTDLLLQQTELDAIKAYIDYQKSVYELGLMVGYQVERS